jgi:hypothetical protein
MAALSSPKINFFITFLLVHDLLRVDLTSRQNFYTKPQKNASKKWPKVQKILQSKILYFALDVKLCFGCRDVHSSPPQGLSIAHD